MSGHRNPPRKKNKSPSHSKPKADEENRGAPEQEARASHDEPSPPTINIIEAAKEKSMAWWRKWSFYKGSMEVLSLFGVSFYCWVTYQQWADLRHNFETDQRAWLAPNWSFNSDKTFSPADVIVPGKMFDGDAAIRLTNMGKSPILRTDTHVWIEILDHGSAPTFNWEYPTSGTVSGFVFPGRYIEGDSHRLHPDGSFFDPTDAEFEALRDGNDYVVAYGYTIYADNFGRHWIRFCGVWRYISAAPTPKDGYKSLSCVAVNAVGDGDNPVADLTPTK